MHHSQHPCSPSNQRERFESPNDRGFKRCFIHRQEVIQSKACGDLPEAVHETSQALQGDLVRFLRRRIDAVAAITICPNKARRDIKRCCEDQ